MTRTLNLGAIGLIAAVSSLGASAAAWAQAPASAGPAIGGQSAQSPVVYMSAADVAKLLEQSKSEHQGNAPNAPYKPVVRVPGYRAQLEYRYGTTLPSIHNNNNELLYIIKGSGTLVMGGTLDNAKPAGNNQNGTGITGGQTYALSEGAFVIVPFGTPHGIGTTDPNGLELFSMFLPAQGAPSPGAAAPAPPAR